MSIISTLFPQPTASPKPVAQQPAPTPAKEEPTITASASQNAASPSSPTQTEAPKETATATPAPTAVSTANQSSKPTSQSVVAARSEEMLSSGTQLPEASVDEDAARAAAEAYRAEARQTAILESISTTPDIAEIGLKEIEESDSSGSGNAYSTAKTDTDITRNQISSERPPLDKVA